MLVYQVGATRRYAMYKYAMSTLQTFNLGRSLQTFKECAMNDKDLLDSQCELHDFHLNFFIEVFFQWLCLIFISLEYFWILYEDLTLNHWLAL